MSDEKRFQGGYREPYDAARFDLMREHARELFDTLAAVVGLMQTNRLALASIDGAATDPEALVICVRANGLLERIEFEAKREAAR